MKKTVKKTFRRSNSWKRKKKKRKNTYKTQKKATKGLVDFNNFLRDEVVEPDQKRLFNLEACNSDKKSSTAINDEKKKAINLCNALVNNSKVFFTLQIK